MLLKIVIISKFGSTEKTVKFERIFQFSLALLKK